MTTPYRDASGRFTQCWRIGCRHCGGTFALWEGELPKADDVIDWHHIRSPYGVAVGRDDVPKCFTCGEGPLGNVTLPEDWTPV